jgi:hypothetical protein
MKLENNVVTFQPENADLVRYLLSLSLSHSNTHRHFLFLAFSFPGVPSLYTPHVKKIRHAIWGVPPGKVTALNSLPNSFFTRHFKDLLEPPPEASGKICSMAARFGNSKGESGPWGTMIQAIVP